MRWFWSLHGIFGKPADMRADGHAATLDEAKAQFESIWRRWLAWAKLGASYAATRLAALPLGGSRRVAPEVDSSIFAEGLCFLAAPKRGERPHQRQSEPNFSLRLLVSQLSSSPAFLCKPLEHARHVHREKPVSMDFRRANIS